MNLKNSYVENLNRNFYTIINPVSVRKPKLICFNHQLARHLNIDYTNSDSEKIAQILSGNEITKAATPIALAYAGHQYGRFVPLLGDGRAILLGEIIDKDGILQDVQLKGSGITPYSRLGDGRAVMGPMIREYVVSEAMHGLGISTTRSLAVISTGEFVMRETLLPGAILTRVAKSHIRIGTFQYFAANKDLMSLKLLADYTIKRHYPELSNDINPYKSLIKAVMCVQIELVVDWLRVGFIHGVMNTDNITVSGQTIDYGPCAFMDGYNINQKYSSIDQYGRYAYGNQISIIIWNILQLTHSLNELVSDNIDEVNDFHQNIIDEAIKKYEADWLRVFGNKIGIVNPTNRDRVLIHTLLDIMQKEALDFTLTFKYLTYNLMQTPWPLDNLIKPFHSLDSWITEWRQCLEDYNINFDHAIGVMNQVNPTIIPRNHLIERVISQIYNQDSYVEMNNLLDVLHNPYKNITDYKIDYMLPPKENERVTATFCGT